MQHIDKYGIKIKNSDRVTTDLFILYKVINQ